MKRRGINYTTETSEQELLQLWEQAKKIKKDNLNGILDF